MPGLTANSTLLQGFRVWSTTEDMIAPELRMNELQGQEGQVPFNTEYYRYISPDPFAPNARSSPEKPQYSHGSFAKEPQFQTSPGAVQLARTRSSRQLSGVPSSVLPLPVSAPSVTASASAPSVPPAQTYLPHHTNFNGAAEQGIYTPSSTFTTTNNLVTAPLRSNPYSSPSTTPDHGVATQDPGIVAFLNHELSLEQQNAYFPLINGIPQQAKIDLLKVYLNNLENTVDGGSVAPALLQNSDASLHTVPHLHTPSGDDYEEDDDDEYAEDEDEDAEGEFEVIETIQRKGSNLSSSVVKSPRVSKHTGKSKNVHRVFKCPSDGCKANFPTRKGLTKHSDIHGPKNEICPWPNCKATFHKVRDLKRHQNSRGHLPAEDTSSPKKEYICTFPGCSRGPDKRFSRRDNARQHVIQRHKVDKASAELNFKEVDVSEAQNPNLLSPAGSYLGLDGESVASPTPSMGFTATTCTVVTQHTPRPAEEDDMQVSPSTVVPHTVMLAGMTGAFNENLFNGVEFSDFDPRQTEVFEYNWSDWTGGMPAMEQR